MKPLVFTLLSEGSSDRALIPVLLWALRRASARVFQPLWADLRWLRAPPRPLEDRVEAAVQLYPCDLLFVHRDGNRVGLRTRREEIGAALSRAPLQPAVAVVPVRAQEAWLLFHEDAIRTAAGNPNGEETLDLPGLSSLENLLDPKRRLHEVLRAASGLGPRRRRSLRLGPAVHRVAELIEDYSPLRVLSAFRAFERELGGVIDEHGWR
jgi:hypothetical protein